MNKEVSAGGLVLRNKKILMVQVKNLEGKIVWTFPKGHLEKKETVLAAALREVKEETGWKCKIIAEKPEVPIHGKSSPQIYSGVIPPFQSVSYQFLRAHQLIHKKVFWFLMKPTKKTGKKDAKEILKVRWFSLEKAKKTASYPSDKKLLAKLTQQ